MTRGIIATPHRLASEVGGAVLRDGGNAIDAAVAADAVLCVVYPHMTTIGGDLVALVWPAGATTPLALLGAGWAGERASVDALRERGVSERMPERGALTVTVPGTVQAWGRLIERFGTFGFHGVLRPASEIARDGFIVTENLANALAQNAGWLMREQATAALFPPVKAGMLLRNTDLSVTLATIGRRGFYEFHRGEIADAIVSTLEHRDGLLTHEDMANWRAEYVEPVSFPWRDLVVFQAPPPSQGLTLIAMLARLRKAAPYARGAELAKEVRRLRDVAYPLRDRYISDPSFVAVPLQPFLEPAHTEPATPLPARSGDTIYLCCADEHGNCVSLIQSVAYPFGSGVVAEGTGVLLQNRGTYFSLDGNHANCIAPRKRTMHTLMPGLVTRAGEPWLVLGNMGADAQPQVQLQVLLNLVSGEPPQEAVSAPRLRIDEAGSLHVEADYPDALAIQQSQPRVQLMPPASSYFGHAQALLREGPDWVGGADPRSDGSVEVVR